MRVRCPRRLRTRTSLPIRWSQPPRRRKLASAHEHARRRLRSQRSTVARLVRPGRLRQAQQRSPTSKRNRPHWACRVALRRRRKRHPLQPAKRPASQTRRRARKSRSRSLRRSRHPLPPWRARRLLLTTLRRRNRSNQSSDSVQFQPIHPAGLRISILGLALSLGSMRILV